MNDRRNLRPLALVLAGLPLLAGMAFGQGQSLDDLLRKGVVVPSTKPPAQAAPQTTQPAAPPAPAAKAPAQRPPQQAPAPHATGPAAAIKPAGGGAFRMNLLPGWNAQLLENGAVLARSGDGQAAVMIAPVLDAGNAAPADWLRRSAPVYLGAYLKNPSVSAVYPSPSSRAAALATVAYAGAAGQAHVLCFISGGIGTVFAIAAPQAQFAQLAGPMVQMLKSFSFTGEKTASPQGAGQAAAPSVQYTKFQDSHEAAFTVEVPAGWKVEGGMQRRSSLDVRPAVYATSPDGGTVIKLGDWDLGAFTEPNQGLAMAGMREGGTYSPGYGNVWIIRRYLPGPQFAQEYAAKLARDTGCSNPRVDNVKPLHDYDKNQNMGAVNIRTSAGEADFTCTRNGRESTGKVVVATTATSMANSGMGALWYASFLASFVAPSNQAGGAEAIGKHMIESFQMSLQWQAQQSNLTMKTSQIAHEQYEHDNKIITETFANTQRVHDRTARNFDDTIRGVVRLRDPDTGDEMEGVAGKNYYYKVPNHNHPVGTDRPIDNDPNVTELEQIR